MLLRSLITSIALLPPIAAFAQAPQHPMPSSLNCPDDQLVWVDIPARAYYFQSDRRFGSTKTGQYTCENAARAAGDRAAKDGW